MRTQKHSKQIEDAIRTIQENYRIGQRILKSCGPKSPPGMIAREAKKHGYSRDKCQKLRAMAMEGTGYRQEELERWYQEFRTAGFALTISHFIKLVSVPSKRERTSLTRQAIKNRWSSHRLQAEIVSRLGRRKRGGRNPTVATGKQFEKELVRVLWSWEHWLRVHIEANNAIAPELLKDVKSLQKRIERLHSSLQAE